VTAWRGGGRARCHSARRASVTAKQAGGAKAMDDVADLSSSLD